MNKSETKNVVVSFRSIESIADQENFSALAELAGPEEEGLPGKPPSISEIVEFVDEDLHDVIGFYHEFHEALKEMEEASLEVDPEVLYSPQNRIAALLQSQMAEEAAALGCDRAARRRRRRSKIRHWRLVGLVQKSLQLGEESRASPD